MSYSYKQEPCEHFWFPIFFTHYALQHHPTQPLFVNFWYVIFVSELLILCMYMYIVCNVFCKNFTFIITIY